MTTKRPTPAERRTPAKRKPAAPARASAPVTKPGALHAFTFYLGIGGLGLPTAEITVCAASPDEAVKRVRKIRVRPVHALTETSGRGSRQPSEYIAFSVDTRDLTVSHITHISDSAGSGRFAPRSADLRPGMTQAEFQAYLSKRRRGARKANAAGRSKAHSAAHHRGRPRG